MMFPCDFGISAAFPRVTNLRFAETMQVQVTKNNKHQLLRKLLTCSWWELKRMKMEVQTGRRQLINLSRRAAEMPDNWSRVSATEDLIEVRVIFCRLRNETEADNEILRTLRASRDKKANEHSQQLLDNRLWLMPLIYGLLILLVTMKNFHARAQKKNVFFRRMQFQCWFSACVSVYCECICQTVEEMAGKWLRIININSFHRFSGFVNLINFFTIFFQISTK